MFRQGVAIATLCFTLASCTSSQRVTTNKPVTFKKASIVSLADPNNRMVTLGAMPAPRKPKLTTASRTSKATPSVKRPRPADVATTLPKAIRGSGGSSQQAAAFAAVEIGGGLANILRARRQSVNNGTRHTLQIRLLDGSDHLVIVQQGAGGSMKLTSHKQTSA